MAIYILLRFIPGGPHCERRSAKLVLFLVAVAAEAFLSRHRHRSLKWAQLMMTTNVPCAALLGKGAMCWTGLHIFPSALCETAPVAWINALMGCG